MRIVLDTNVLIAALISRGLCFEILEHTVRNHTSVSSDYIQNELVDKLENKFKFSATESREVASLLFERFTLVTPENFKPEKNFPDPDDIPVIGTALAGKSPYLVTGDKALQNLKKIKGIEIISPSEFWRIG